ncbi:flagellar assembly protein FliH [Lutimaribacter pacificus]|uniref:Flagellar assembly protein FliH n=1 Tax=Lutimaribacter pacificus TaxID=391948 RepID=A0A1H0EER7_9RHOB|nr:ABC transporter ATP-binding protein [Lutimaribacter pacificus]SDN80808.1 flagellar assembly protein FliH [Lutimaribacter pacificus]SHK53799.1 flagellar assembly protein FliH [Lutimaribacter pacificus]
MSLHNLLEDFGDFDTGPLVLSGQALEDHRLNAFERGYQAGWDDATKAHSQEQSHIGAELARNLQDLSFTYHEVQAALLHNLDPLFDALLNTFLPTMAADALTPRIVEELTGLAREIGGGPIVLSVAPSQAGRVASLLPEESGLSVSVQPDGTLGEGQAFLRLGDRERMIDLDQTLEDIRQRVSAFLETAQEDRKHG